MGDQPTHGREEALGAEGVVMRIKGRKRWGKGVLDSLGKEVERLSWEVLHELTELREIETPGLEDVQNIGVMEGALQAFRWIERVVRGDIDVSEFRGFVDQILREAVDEQRAKTRYGGPADGWRDYASNTAWDRKTYADIGYHSSEIDVFLKLNRDYALGLDPALVREAKHYIY